MKEGLRGAGLRRSGILRVSKGDSRRQTGEVPILSIGGVATGVGDWTWMGNVLKAGLCGRGEMSISISRHGDKSVGGGVLMSSSRR